MKCWQSSDKSKLQGPAWTHPCCFTAYVAAGIIILTRCGDISWQTVTRNLPNKQLLCSHQRNQQISHEALRIFSHWAVCVVGVSRPWGRSHKSVWNAKQASDTSLFECRWSCGDDGLVSLRKHCDRVPHGWSRYFHTKLHLFSNRWFGAVADQQGLIGW